MAEKSGFFDAHLVDGTYDRVYLAESFAKYFASFIANGVFGKKLNELMVQQKSTPDMSVKVLSGQAWINGYWYENEDELSLSIDVADGVLNRIDLIVLRWDNLERVIRLAVKKGTPATNAIVSSLQRDDDYYELELAKVYVKAGTTKIMQADITDTRMQEDVCGLVANAVQQFDDENFGIQLSEYIQQFIAEYDILKNETSEDIETWKTQTKSSYNTWFAQFKADSNTAIDNLLSTNQAKIDTLIETKTMEINNLISSNEEKFNESMAELEEIKADNDLTLLNQKVTNLRTDMDEFNNLFVESGTHPGCYYRIVNNENEWINPPNEVGIAYKTTERWNGKPVYQKLFYIGALPNKTYMYFNVDARFDRIVSVSGFAVDSDNNLNYPFPIIINGLTPVAVIQSAEGDGGEGSGITIQTNEDISSFIGYVTVKYTKE